MCSFINNMFHKWTNGKAYNIRANQPSFSQHNLCLVVWRHCLHVSVTKFQDKFASLRKVNSSNSWDKFQIIMLYRHVMIRFLPNFALFCVFLWISLDILDLPGFPSSMTRWNNYQRPCLKGHIQLCSVSKGPF